MVVEQNNLEQKTKELDELITLAEQVSSKIKLLKNNFTINLIVFVMLIVSVGIYYPYIVSFINFTFPNEKNFDFVAQLTIFLSFFIISIATVIKNNKIRKEIADEDKILTKLHNMITTHKRGIDNELGILSNAIYEMRLSRIQFNFNNTSKNPLFRLITSLLG